MNFIYKKFKPVIQMCYNVLLLFILGFFITTSNLLADEGGQAIISKESTTLEAFEDDFMEFDSLEQSEEQVDVSNIREKTIVLKSFVEATRFTLGHELSYKIKTPDEVINNRSWFRAECDKFFYSHFFFRADAKLNSFWHNDHQAESKADDILLESHIKEIFLQASFSQTSVTVGYQILIWGESDGGAITDVISPRDFSELFFVSLEESRISQPMVTLDQFTEYGQWSFFYIPEVNFNEYPEIGTAYYFNPFGSAIKIQDEISSGDQYEFGCRWKKTVKKADLALMAASLLYNDKMSTLANGSQSDGFILKQTAFRYNMFGFTFNFPHGNFLFKGECGFKNSIPLNTNSFGIKEKITIDSTLGLEHSPGSSYTLGFEAVNNHIVEWEDTIAGVPQETFSLVLNLQKTFFNEDLSVDVMGYYTHPYSGYLYTLRTSYKWDDNLTLFFDLFCPVIQDKRNGFWPYRDQKQFLVKVQYQF